MAKQTLPTNFKDDILNSSMGGKRRYNQTTNADGTVSLEDASTYDQVGSNFGALQLNAISKAVNQSADSSKIISDPDTASATTEQGYIADVQLFNHLNDSLGGLQFGVDENGNYGYIKAGADSVTPFKKGIFSEWDGLDYITDGLTIASSRVTINSGGYCLKDNFCYIKMNITSNINFSTNDAIYNFPITQNIQSIFFSSEENEFIPLSNVSGTLRPTTSPQRLEIYACPKDSTVWMYAKYPIIQ